MEEKELELVRSKQRELSNQIIQMQNQISQLAEKMEYIAKISEDLGNIMDKPDTREGSPAGRLQCPKCSSLKVREVEDKDNVVSFIPKPIYGTKYICTDCKNEWR